METQKRNAVRALIFEMIGKEMDRAEGLHSPFRYWLEAHDAMRGEHEEIFHAMCEGDVTGEHGIIREAVQLAGTAIKTIVNLCTEEEIRSCIR